VNYFTYNGIRSSDMGLRIESKNVFSAPEYEMEFLAIPGRDGDLISGSGRYPNVQVTYSVFLPAKTTSELADKITRVKAWLYAGMNTYHTLTDTYDTAFYRTAVFAGKLDIEDELNKIGVFTVSFSCLPFRYLLTGDTPISFTSGTILHNPYPFVSRPLIHIVGSGEGTLTIQSAADNSTWRFLEIDEYVDIDSEQMNFYKGTELKNDTVSGDGFPLLYPGDNPISVTGGITTVIVTPRWCTL